MDSPIKINVDLTEENVLCIMPNILNKKMATIHGNRSYL